MLRIIEVFIYLVFALPVGWLVWHWTRDYPLAVRLCALAALALGLIDGRRRRRARRSPTFPDFSK